VTLMVDESCWLRMLPQVLTEEAANSEIYRKGLYLMPASLPAKVFQKAGSLGSDWSSS
jgi:hypothetical protein